MSERAMRWVGSTQLGFRLLPVYDSMMAGFSPEAINRRKTHCKRGHEFTAQNTL